MKDKWHLEVALAKAAGRFAAMANCASDPKIRKIASVGFRACQAAIRKTRPSVAKQMCL